MEEGNRKTVNFEEKIPHYSPNGLGDKLKKILLAFIVIAAAGVVGLGSAYQVREQEQVVLTTLGKAQAVTEPGLHFKIPLIQQVQKVNTTIQGFAIGYDEMTGETISSEAVMITSDYNFIDVDFFIEYKVSDPVKAVYASSDPVKILKNLAQSSIRNVIGSYDVDSVLTTGKNEIQASIKETLTSQLEKHDIGLTLVNVTIQDSEPPTVEIMEAFKNVETAKQGKETAINNANKYRNEKLPTAEAEADKIIKEAEAYKQERINEATGQVARFNAMYEEYIKNPTVTKQRMFYEAMEEVLPDLELIIDSSNGVQKILPLDSFFTTEETSNTQKEEN
ncbi:MAG: FtsH protease activity modulator HflK [Lachnospiraceae bacterium]|nr:FtsH protease activity modulator HflK [Lachnospiraceae bacterium]